MKKFRIAALCLLLLAGCTKTPVVDPVVEQQSDFSKLTYDWFVEDMGSDYLNLHFSLKNPEAFGIKDVEVTLGDVEVPDDYSQYKDRLEQLKQIDVTKLNEEEKIAYDCLVFSYETGQMMLDLEEDYDFVFTPNSGVNNNLPTNFTEFEFRSNQDFEDFIVLVNDCGRFFDLCLDYTKKQAEKGIIQNDECIDEIIESCERFISNREDNEIIKIFNLAVDSFKPDNADSLKARLRDAVINVVIPSYEKVIAYYKTLYGKSKNSMGLAQYPYGKEYYEVLFRQKACTDASVFEMEKKLRSEISKTVKSIRSVAQSMSYKDYNAYINDSYDYGYSDPYDILEYIKSKMEKDYPTIPDVSYSVNYLDESVATDSVVAYYLIAPFDDVTNNVIKCNRDYCENDPNYLCTTLSHEGYPGHLFQNTYYFSNHSSLPIRYSLDFIGYAEGWAMYVEYDTTYYFASEDYSKLANLYEQLGYYIYGYMDIMFNYEGWTIQQAADYLGQFYTYPEEVAESIMSTVVGDPGMYLPYSLGYYQMNSLREQAKKALDKKFNLKEYNTLILDIGSAPFTVLQEKVDAYIAEKK